MSYYFFCKKMCKSDNKSNQIRTFYVDPVINETIFVIGFGVKLNVGQCIGVGLPNL